MTDRQNNLLPILTVALSFSLLACLIGMSVASFGAISDLPEYYAAARLAITGNGNQIYDLAALGAAENKCFPSLSGRTIGLMVPPPAIPLLVPLALCPENLAPIFWKMINFAALLGSLYVLKRAYGLDHRTFLWLLTWLPLTYPLFEALRIDQLAPLLLLALSISIKSVKDNRPLMAAAGLFWLKPQQILPFLLVLFANGRLKVLFIAAGISLILAAGAFALLGHDGISKYSMVFSPAVDPFMQSSLGATLRGQLLRLFPDAHKPVMLASLAALIASCLLIFFQARRFAKTPYGMEIGTLLAMPLGLTTSLHCHDYDLILLTPSIIILVKYADKWKRCRWLLPIFGLIIMSFMLPFGISVHYDYLLKGGAINPYFWELLALAVGILVIVRVNQEEFDL